MNILVNGRKKKTSQREFSYADIVTLAGQDPDLVLTVTWSHGPFFKTSSILSPGKSTLIVEDMIFHVADISNT